MPQVDPNIKQGFLTAIQNHSVYEVDSFVEQIKAKIRRGESPHNEYETLLMDGFLQALYKWNPEILGKIATVPSLVNFAKGYPLPSINPNTSNEYQYELLCAILALRENNDEANAASLIFQLPGFIDYLNSGNNSNYITYSANADEIMDNLALMCIKMVEQNNFDLIEKLLQVPNVTHHLMNHDFHDEDYNLKFENMLQKALSWSSDNGKSEMLKALIVGISSRKEIKESLLNTVLDVIENQGLTTLLPAVYQGGLSRLADMIFIEQSENAPNKVASVPSPGKIKTIYNNKGYLKQGGYSPNMGKPLSLEIGDVPIGYNIHLPPTGTEIKNVIVHVYGGYKAHEREEKAYKPDDPLSDFDKYLLQNGTAVITLNLPDLLKLTGNQQDMPENLHKEIHACIHRFYDALKQPISPLHKELDKINLKDKPVFLYGASFGGSNAIRHAEKYPGTFSGYISHDGALSSDMEAKSDRLSRGEHKSWLNPAEDGEIEKIQDYLLLMHSMDDNNVNAKVVTDFYQKLAQHHKSHLARFCATTQGNPTPSDDPTQKGHFTPTYEAEFKRYADTVVSFMQRPSVLPAMSAWQAYQKDILANKFYKEGTIQQKFIAQVFDNSRLGKIENSDINKLLSDNETDSVWEANFKPIYYAIHLSDQLMRDYTALSEEIQRLTSMNLLRDEVIKNLLKSQSNVFINYVKEIYGKDVTSEMVSEDAAMISACRQYITQLASKPYAEVQTMLSQLYQANPSLLEAHYPKFNAQPQTKAAEMEAKKALVKSLKKERRMIAHVWERAAKKVVTLQKDKILSAEPQVNQDDTKKTPTKGL